MVRYYDSWVAAAKTDALAERIVRRYHQRPREELYDVLKDPWEMNNLAGDPAHEAALKELRGKLDAWMREQQDTKKMFNEPIPLTAEGRPAIPALPRPQTSP